MYPKLLPFFKQVLLICTFLFLSANANAANSNDDKGSIPVTPAANDSKEKPAPKKEEQKSNAIVFTGEVAFKAAKLPNDTFARFIELYGKDSLLHFVNKKINKAVKFMNFESKLLSDEFQIAELLLYSKQFNLGIDTLKYPNFQLKSAYYRLYNRNISNPAAFFDTIAYRKKSEAETNTFFQENINNRGFRIGIAAFSNYLNFPQKTFDTLYQLKDRLAFPDEIELYFILTEFAKNNPSKNEMVQKYRAEIFQNLYSKNNITYFTEDFDLNNTDNNPLINTYRILSYGLYGNDITLKKNAQDLMYLLSLQYPDGGWRNSFNSPAEDMGDRNTTIYALWALCEFRDQLVKYKVKPD